MWKCCRNIATTLASVLTVALTQRTIIAETSLMDDPLSLPYFEPSEDDK